MEEKLTLLPSIQCNKSEEYGIVVQMRGRAKWPKVNCPSGALMSGQLANALGWIGTGLAPAIPWRGSSHGGQVLGSFPPEFSEFREVEQILIASPTISGHIVLKPESSTRAVLLPGTNCKFLNWTILLTRALLDSSFPFEVVFLRNSLISFF